MRLRTVDRAFRDELGREIIFNGINLVCKEKEKGYLGGYDRVLIEQLSRWGFNLVRLGIIWDGIEPEPGKYNVEYIKAIGNYMDLCHEFGISVFLDMHQDLFSFKYSDGAPSWATLDEGKPHITGDIWSDAYLLSPAVQTSFDNFWANKPASDGIGVMDHFATAWVRVLSILGEHPALIGVDFLNEPFPGSSAVNVYGATFAAFGKTISEITGEEVSAEEAAGIFSDHMQMAKVLMMLDDYELYKKTTDGVMDFIQSFDSGILNDFYIKITEKVRKNGYKGIIMQENQYFSNAGVMSGVKPIKINNKEDQAQCYAPHGYDLVVDTDAVGALASKNRVRVIFDNHHNVQSRLNVPVVVGEWGAFGLHNNTQKHCRDIIEIFEDYKWSNTYWCYQDNFHNAPVLEALVRAYPLKTAGDLISYHYDYENRVFEMEWMENDNEADSIIYLPFIIENLPVKGEIHKNGTSCTVTIHHTGGLRNLKLKQ